MCNFDQRAQKDELSQRIDRETCLQENWQRRSTAIVCLPIRSALVDPYPRAWITSALSRRLFFARLEAQPTKHRLALSWFEWNSGFGAAFSTDGLRV
jgi:hypothetical protein